MHPHKVLKKKRSTCPLRQHCYLRLVIGWPYKKIEHSHSTLFCNASSSKPSQLLSTIATVPGGPPQLGQLLLRRQQPLQNKTISWNFFKTDIIKATNISYRRRHTTLSDDPRTFHRNPSVNRTRSRKNVLTKEDLNQIWESFWENRNKGRVLYHGHPSDLISIEQR